MLHLLARLVALRYLQLSPHTVLLPNRQHAER